MNTPAANTRAARHAVRPSDCPGAVSTPFRDLLGCLAVSAGLGAALFGMAGSLSYFSASMASAFHGFLGLG